jgi:hypothetical protein
LTYKNNLARLLREATRQNAADAFQLFGLLSLLRSLFFEMPMWWKLKFDNCSQILYRSLIDIFLPSFGYCAISTAS